jgi:murein DD-endopeptidase MepM/ murein hydrolase activator NlpD
VIASACVVDYVGLLSQSIENRRLRAENVILKQQFQVVEGKLNALETGLERVKGFVTKLRLITNVETEDRTLKLAIGPLPRVGQSVEPELMDAGEEDDRSPASARGAIVPASDAVFAQKAPVDELQGELTVEGQRDYGSLAIRIDQAVQETTIREQGILELWETLSERQSLMAATPSIKPVRGWFTSKFGYRISPFTQRPVMHNGLDIAAAPGSPISAPADGVVSFAGYDPGYGKLVSIDHGYGVVTRFGHTSQIFVEVGQKVKRRDVVAAVGNTGRSTGPHCHYEVRVNGVPVDPQNYVLDEQ